MKHIHYSEEPPEEVREAGAQGIQLRTVIGEKDGAPNFFMRIIRFEPGSRSPHHSHPWEHENFILRGQGTVEVDGQTVQLREGDVLYIPPHANHCFRAQESMEMICLIPRR